MVEIFKDIPKAPDDRELKTSGNTTNDLIEGAYNLNRKKLYEGHRKIQAELGELFISIRGILSEILTHTPSGDFETDISMAKKGLSRAELNMKILWNPNGISGLNILGSVYADSLPKFKIQRYEEMKRELEKEMEPLQRKFDTSVRNIRRAIKDCESLLKIGPAFQSQTPATLIPVDNKLIALFGAPAQSSGEADEELAA